MINRRRFMVISAAALAWPARGSAHPVYTWTGRALGARVAVRLAHPEAPQIANRVAAEISRLEDIFSLFRADSALCRLNRNGALRAPPFELLECLSLAGAVHAATEGCFDPTIQPLWQCYAQASAAARAPDPRALAAARRLIGWDQVRMAPDAITLQPGMGLSLNGIAQGYICDRVATLLEREGLTDVLIDTGELRALGRHPRGGAWPVKLNDGRRIELSSRALATSAPLGTTFDAAATQSHILDPRTGQPVVSRWQEITVSANSAALADALSTAACLMTSTARIEHALASFAGSRLEFARARL